MNAILTALDFTGTRRATITAVTTPKLVKGHPFGGNTTVHNLRKAATVDVMIGGKGTYSFLVQCLWNVLAPVTNAAGEVERFVAEPSWGDYPRRADGSTYTWLAHTRKGDTEPTLYLPCSIVRSVSHCYSLTDGTVVPNATVDGTWTARETVPQTQRLTADSFIRWRKYTLANIASVTIGGTVTAGEAEDRFRQMMAGHTTAEVAAVFNPATEGAKANG
jgi:hypothetical protein